MSEEVDIRRILGSLKRIVKNMGGKITEISEGETEIRVKLIFSDGPVLHKIDRALGYNFWEGGERKDGKDWIVWMRILDPRLVTPS